MVAFRRMIDTFREPKLGRRLVLSFLTLAVLMAYVSIFSFRELHKVLGPLTKDIPHALEELETTSHLDSLAQKIRHYDLILTEAARNYAYTGDRQWKYRYQEFEPRLEAAIREAIEKGDQEDQKTFQDVQRAKKIFVELEYESVSAVDRGDKTAAAAILDGLDYWNSKREYKNRLEKYVERRGKKYGDTLVVTSTKVDVVVKRTHQLVQESIRVLVVISMIMLGLAIILGLLVSRSILRPIRFLQQGTEVIGRGDLDHRIKIFSLDEIGQLAAAFNEMAVKLKESYSGLEEKVNEKTRQLAQKVEEIEDQNKILEIAKKATLNILEDLEVAKSAVEEEKAKDEAILASIGDGMIATDPSGKIIMMNKQAEVMLGWSAKEAIGAAYAEIVVGEDEKENRIPPERMPALTCIAKSKKIVASNYYIRRDRTRFPVAVTVSPIVRDGKTVGAIEIFRDISKEKEIDRMKTEFISTVSHELRTPLTVIREGVALVLDNVLGPTTDDQRTFLNMALSDIDRLTRIINNLLDVAKIEAGKVEVKRSLVDIVEIAKGISSTFQTRVQTKGLKLVEAFSAPSIPIYVDKDKLIQVFTNLVGNALKFTEAGKIEVAVSDQGESVMCSVTDTGKGIAEEDIPKVFSKFQQFGRSPGSGEKGTGLGLSIAKGIVEMHNGKIWVESTVGQGTAFHFTLPKYTPKRLFKEYVNRGLREAMSQRTVLTVLWLELKGADNLGREAGAIRSNEILNAYENIVKSHYSFPDVQMQRDGNVTFLMLPATDKSAAVDMIRKIQKDLMDLLNEKGLRSSLVEVCYQVASYPEDGSTEEELIDRIAA